MSGWDKQCQKVQRVTKQHVGFQKTCPNHCTVGIPLIFLFLQARGKEKLEYLPCEHFLQGFEIYRPFFRAEQVGENCGKIQNPVKIAHKADFLIFISLYILQ